MIKWEYDIKIFEHLNFSALMKELNDLGSHGWEVCGFSNISGNPCADFGDRKFILKRQLENRE